MNNKKSSSKVSSRMNKGGSKNNVNVSGRIVTGQQSNMSLCTFKDATLFGAMQPKGSFNGSSMDSNFLSPLFRKNQNLGQKNSFQQNLANFLQAPGVKSNPGFPRKSSHDFQRNNVKSSFKIIPNQKSSFIDIS